MKPSPSPPPSPYSTVIVDVWEDQWGSRHHRQPGRVPLPSPAQLGVCLHPPRLGTVTVWWLGCGCGGLSVGEARARGMHDRGVHGEDSRGATGRVPEGHCCGGVC